MRAPNDTNTLTRNHLCAELRRRRARVRRILAAAARSNRMCDVYAYFAYMYIFHIYAARAALAYMRSSNARMNQFKSYKNTNRETAAQIIYISKSGCVTSSTYYFAAATFAHARSISRICDSRYGLVYLMGFHERVRIVHMFDSPLCSIDANGAAHGFCFCFGILLMVPIRIDTLSSLSVAAHRAELMVCCWIL